MVPCLAGSPPKIPEKATLIFEIELLDFVSKDDLFRDGGVVKVVQKEGSGWKVPKNKSEQRTGTSRVSTDFHIFHLSKERLLNWVQTSAEFSNLFQLLLNWSSTPSERVSLQPLKTGDDYKIS